MAAGLETSSRDWNCQKAPKAKRIASPQTHDLVGDAGSTFTPSASNDQISSIVGVKVDGEYREWKGGFRVRDCGS